MGNYPLLGTDLSLSSALNKILNCYMFRLLGYAQNSRLKLASVIGDKRVAFGSLANGESVYRPKLDIVQI